MEGFDSFLDGFERTGDGFYIPRDASHNHYRHYGIRRDGKLLLVDDEVLFLYDPVPREYYPLRTKAYFHVRNSFYNLLPSESGKFMLFKKTKDFNRKKDRPTSVLRYVHRDNAVGIDAEDEVLCILSDAVFTFMRSKRIRELDSTTDNKLKKASKVLDPK
jgi:hypothetical protein